MGFFEAFALVLVPRGRVQTPQPLCRYLSASPGAFATLSVAFVARALLFAVRLRRRARARRLREQQTSQRTMLDAQLEAAEAEGQRILCENHRRRVAAAQCRGRRPAGRATPGRPPPGAFAPPPRRAPPATATHGSPQSFVPPARRSGDSRPAGAGARAVPRHSPAERRASSATAPGSESSGKPSPAADSGGNRAAALEKIVAMEAQHATLSSKLNAPGIRAALTSTRPSSVPPKLTKPAPGIPRATANRAGRR